MYQKAIRPQDCNFIKKEALAQVFSCEFCEISKNTLFIEHLWWLLLIVKCINSIRYKINDLEILIQDIPLDYFIH